MRAINTFWNWFQDNNQTIKNIQSETPKNQKHILFWLDKNLSYYCKELSFMITFPKNPKHKFKFIISANGNPDYFKQVTDLIDNAPKLRTWKFIAFIQPTKRIDQMIDGLDGPYIFPEITLKASELKFLPLGYDEETKKINITIYLKNDKLLCDTKTLDQAIFIIMLDVLGEKSLYKNINFIQLAQLPYNADNLIHLHDFETFIDILNLDD